MARGIGREAPSGPSGRSSGQATFRTIVSVAVRVMRLAMLVTVPCPCSPAYTPVAPVMAHGPDSGRAVRSVKSVAVSVQRRSRVPSALVSVSSACRMPRIGDGTAASCPWMLVVPESSTAPVAVNVPLPNPWYGGAAGAGPAVQVEVMVSVVGGWALADPAPAIASAMAASPRTQVMWL